METRQVTQTKIYKLMLNDMRSSNIENTTIAAIAVDKKELEDFIEGEKESWKDDRWGKSFKKDSPLEWFNKPFESFSQQGIHEEWIEDVYDLNDVNELAKNKNLFFVGGLETASYDLDVEPKLIE